MSHTHSEQIVLAWSILTWIHLLFKECINIQWGAVVRYWRWILTERNLKLSRHCTNSNFRWIIFSSRGKDTVHRESLEWWDWTRMREERNSSGCALAEWWNKYKNILRGNTFLCYQWFKTFLGFLANLIHNPLTLMSLAKNVLQLLSC